MKPLTSLLTRKRSGKKPVFDLRVMIQEKAQEYRKANLEILRATARRLIGDQANENGKIDTEENR